MLKLQKVMMKTCHSKAIHICNSHEPSLTPKIAKEYASPTLTEEKVRPHNNVYKLLGSKW